jgi:hypothetical protein
MTAFVVRAFPFVAALSLALSAAGTAAANQIQAGVDGTPPPPGTVTVSLVAMNGTGCRGGTGSVSISPDNTSLLATHGEFSVQAGGDARPTDARRQCQMAIDIRPPAGYQYALRRADNEGFVDLADGAFAQLRTTSYFAGTSEQPTLSRRFDGPLTDNWQTSAEVPVAALVYSRCNMEESRLFNIKTSLLVQRGADPTVTSFFALTSGDGVANLLIGLAWRRCP